MEQEKFERVCRFMIKIIIALVVLCLLLVTILLIVICGNNETNISNNEMKNDETTEPFEESTTKDAKAVLSATGPSKDYYYQISGEDKELIAKVVWAESRGECFEGKVAVAAVVLNRYFYGVGQGFDRKSIESVITQKNQFASISNVTEEKLESNPDCMRAVEAACKGWDPTRTMFPQGALFFYAPKGVTGYQAEIREGIRVLVIGNHNFHYDFDKVAVG